MSKFKQYILNLLIAFDQLINTIFFGNPDETISSRVGRKYPNSSFARFINAIFFWQKNHVIESIEWDEINKKDK